MKRTSTRLALPTFSLVLVLAVSTVRAQQASYPAPGTSATVNASGSRAGGIPAATNTYAPSYSYWTAAYYGFPPRTYVGLGSQKNDFPYYGRPYGSPSDPWSWPAMAGYGAGIPTRYYPVLP
jgi:hypothetical protein